MGDKDLKLKEYHRDYYKRNRDKLLERSREREAKLKVIRKEQREQRKLKREIEAPERLMRSKAKTDAWREANKDRIRETSKAWRLRQSEDDKKQRLIEKADYDKRYYNLNCDKKKKAAKDWSDGNKERAKAYRKEWRARNKEWVRTRNWIACLRLKGMSLEQYESLLLAQNECCAICNVHKSNWNIPLCVDHDHATNKIRGLLCRSCNSALGLFGDNPINLRNAATYLEKVS